MDAPAFPTRTGRRRDRSNVLMRVVGPVTTRADALRAEHGEPPIRTHVTPHTLRRTYITFMVAAGYDLPYIQAQVGHVDPSTTLAIHAQLMARRDRDELRSEIRELFGGVSTAASDGPAADSRNASARRHDRRIGLPQKAAKGRTVGQ